MMYSNHGRGICSCEVLAQSRLQVLELHHLLGVVVANQTRYSLVPYF